MTISPPPISVTIIGGYLGAGKTTLLNALLRDEHGLRLAILVNDFGSTNVDAALIASHDGETISLTNGCVCCSMGDNLAVTLLELLSRDVPPDHIVIEASGVADPRKIAFYGAAHPRLRLDSLIIVADAETIRARASDKYVGELVMLQLAEADLIVLSKLDLIDQPQREAVRKFLGETVPRARVVAAGHGRLPWDLLLGSRAGRPSRPTAAQHFEALCVLPTAEHESLFDRWGFETEHPFDRERLRVTMESLPKSVLRAKGALYLADNLSNSVILQAVGARWTLEDGKLWSDGPRCSQLVLIGMAGSLNAAQLSENFGSALADQPRVESG